MGRTKPQRQARAAMRDAFGPTANRPVPTSYARNRSTDRVFGKADNFTKSGRIRPSLLGLRCATPHKGKPVIY